MTKRDQIAALVGEEATDLAYRANTWLLRGALAVFPTVPALAVIAFELHLPVIFVAVAAAFVVCSVCLAYGAKLNRRATRAASAYLSRRDGLAITVKSGGIRPWAWQKEIERAHQRASRLKSASATRRRPVPSTIRSGSPERKMRGMSIGNSTPKTRSRVVDHAR
jgi:hypothetical protein